MKWPGVRVGSPRLPSFRAGQMPGSSGRSLGICHFPRPPPLPKGESSFPSWPFGQSRNWKELLVPDKLYIAQQLTAGSPASGLGTAFRSHIRTIVPVSRKAGGNLLVALYACGINWNSPLLGEEDVTAATIFQKGKWCQVAWIMWGPAPPSVNCRAWRASPSLDRVFWKLTPTARGTDKETVSDFRAVLKPTTRDYDFGGRNWDVMILMRHRWGCWVKGRGCLSLGRKLRWFTSKFRVMFPEDWLGFVSLNIFAHTKGKKPIIPVLFMTFVLFKLVSQCSPRASIWPVCKTPCKLSHHWTHSCPLANVFVGQAVSFYYPPTSWLPQTLY